jgi:hypothetical protein
MQEYIQIEQAIAKEEKEDIVTAEEFPTDSEAHPRSVILVRRTNGLPYPFLTSTLVNVINMGNGLDPVTRQPFSELTKQRVQLYHNCLLEFPDVKIKDLNIVDLFRKWIDTHKSRTVSNDAVMRTRLHAQCFLQMEDLLGIFRSFNGKGALTNRSSAAEFLTSTGRSWVLRDCSLQDTKYDKAYALTYRNGRETNHVPIVHRIGEGFFYDVNLPRQTSVGGYFPYSRSYPTIICLLEEEIPLLLRETADSGIEMRI